MIDERREMKRLLMNWFGEELPFHINSKETFDLIGGIGRVGWFGLVEGNGMEGAGRQTHNQ